MDRTSNISISTHVLIAMITGILAGIPAILTFINTPRQIESELGKVRLQSETQIKLQRDQEVAKILAKLDDPDAHIGAGAALSLSVLGGEEVVPILVGKLRESTLKLSLLEMNTDGGHESSPILEERRFINALKQSILTIGLPALQPLVELNREMRLTPKAYSYRRSRTEAITREKEEGSYARASEEVKDVIRSLLLKTSMIKGSQKEKVSPIAQSGISLSDTDLSQMPLSRINLAGVDLKNAFLRGCALNETDFSNANLEGAILDGTFIVKANFKKANLAGSQLKNIQRFMEAKVEEADFSSAIIDNDDLKMYLRQNGALNVP